MGFVGGAAWRPSKVVNELPKIKQDIDASMQSLTSIIQSMPDENAASEFGGFSIFDITGLNQLAQDGSSELLLKELSHTGTVQAAPQLRINPDESFSTLEEFISSFTARYPNFSLSVNKLPMFSGMQVSCTDVFKVSIAFSHDSFDLQAAIPRFRIDRVNVVAWHEEASLWTPSRLQLFDQLGAQFTAAAEHFLFVCSPNTFIALQHFLVWLTYYESLFSAICLACHRHLCYESDLAKFVPPLLRTYTNGAAYHSQCIAGPKFRELK